MSMSFYHLYKNYRVVKPGWPRRKTAYYCLLTIKTLARERRDSIYFLLTGRSFYKTKIVNKGILDNIYNKGGAVIISTHSSSYPLLAMIHGKFYKDKKLAIPHKARFFGHLKRKFSSMGIEVVRLGGAMKEIDKVLKNKGSVLLYIDTEMPEKYSQEVDMFGKSIHLSTSPLWISKKYGIPIVPMFVKKEGNYLKLVVYESIQHKNLTKVQAMQKIANTIEMMILDSLKVWNMYDRFLINREPFRKRIYGGVKGPEISYAFAKVVQKVIYMLLIVTRIGN